MKIFGHGEHVTHQVLMETESDKLHCHTKIQIAKTFEAIALTKTLSIFDQSILR